MRKKPGVYRDMEARRAYRRAWMAARGAGAQARRARKNLSLPTPQKSNRAIAAEPGVAFKTVARAQGLQVCQFGTPEKTIGLDGKSYPEGPA